MAIRHRFKNMHTDQDGFSIIEVTIAMAIFSIGILAIWSLQLNAAKGNTKAQSVTYSSEWAINQVEWLLVKDYNDPDLEDTDDDYGDVTTHSPNADSDHIDNDYDGQIDEAGESGPLSISWTVDEVVPDNTTDIYNYKIVTVTVTKTVGTKTRTIILENRVPNIV